MQKEIRRRDSDFRTCIVELNLIEQESLAMNHTILSSALFLAVFITSSQHEPPREHRKN